MLDAISTFFSLYWHFIIPLVILIFMAIPIAVNWQEVRYWLTLVRINTPVVGRVAHWVRNIGAIEKPTPENPNAAGFTESEQQLCGAFEHYYRQHEPSEAHFRRCQNYLLKIDEDGRKEKGIGLWFLIIALTLVEATAFGYAMAPFALTMATPNMAVGMAFGIGLAISILCLLLAEKAGHQLYKNSVVTKIMSYETLRSQGESGDMIRKDMISIDNTYDDDERPQYQQMLNRVSLSTKDGLPTRSYGLVAAYVVFIVMLGIAAFWVRTETLKAQEADLVANPTQVAQADDFPAGDDFPIPSSMQDVAKESANMSAQDQIDAIHRGSLVTFGVLSGLFVFIQLTSTYLAYSYCFVGSQSQNAWRKTRKFSSADEYSRYHAAKASSIGTDAQSALGKLQTLQQAKQRVRGDDRDNVQQDKSHRTFLRYIAEKNGKVLAQNSRMKVENFIKKSHEELERALDRMDLGRINRICAQAMPRLEAITDPALFQARDNFYMLAGKAKVQPNQQEAQQPQEPVTSSAPSNTAEEPAPQVAESAPVETAQPAAPVATAAPVSAGAFNPNQFGDLTEFLEEDLEYVANSKGVDLDTIKRARRLQMLSKPSSQPA